jgi:peptidoglycan/LPS O-acetylase OafA/YrhL
MQRYFLPELQAMRGVAALLVVCFHAWQIPYLLPGADKTKNIARSFTDPNWFWNSVATVHHYVIGGFNAPIHPAVLFFFVLSGFVLAGMLERDGNGFRFFISRLFRLMPAIWVNIIFFVVLWYAFRLRIGNEWYGVGGIVANALLLSTSINGVMWTLQNELLAMPFVYGAYLLRARAGTVALIVATLLLTALSPWDPVRAALNLDHHIGWMWVFLVGMCGYYAGPSVVRGIIAPSSAAIFAGLLVVFFFCTLVVTPGSPVRQMIEAGCAIGMVVLVAFGPAMAASRVLGSPILQFYGRISYSVYLWHFVVMTVLWKQPVFFGKVIASGVPPIAVALLASLVTIAGTTPLAWLSYRYVEVPGVHLGKRLFGVRPQPAVAAP